MTTKMIDRTAEKLKLAEELGLKAYVSKFNEEKARKDTINEITQMEYKPFTSASTNFFPKWKFDKSMFFKDWNVRAQLTVMVFAASIIISGIGFEIKETGPISVALTILYLAAIGIGGYSLGTCFRRIEVAKMSLLEWKDELPYGALLALKQAKEAGVKENYSSQWVSKYVEYQAGNPRHHILPKQMLNNGFFAVDEGMSENVNLGYNIYYPQFEDSVRLKADPIITGFYKGIEVEIFAWDDSKVHPSER